MKLHCIGCKLLPEESKYYIMLFAISRILNQKTSTTSVIIICITVKAISEEEMELEFADRQSQSSALSQVKHQIR